MPNRGLGRQIGTDDPERDSRDKDTNVQEISTDMHTGNNPGGGTNFQHQRKDSSG